ncbi:MAG: N-acetylmuramic acid 6-phosphate etherase [Acidimicrobiaceae bacterium]|nr:N-acetylmuramic acid 6-phosphate etherase [Acidimicrobiaceae bacterium]
MSGDLESLATLDSESVRPELAELDKLAVPELVALMAAESARASDAVGRAVPNIAAAVELVTGRLSSGGRLIYVGAGTAGRLGVLDAAEAGPTFDVPEGTVLAVLAGGGDAVVRPSEGAEDDENGARGELERLGCSAADAVVGISASGRTPFVLGAIAYARSVGAGTVGIAGNAGSALARAAEIGVELLVGGEVIAGSTRLNAGTAQKITLNIISSATMVQLGKTYGNLMIDVRATNEKLRDRASRIVAAASGASPAKARAALEASGWRPKVATLVVSHGLDPEEAADLLASWGGRLRPAMEAAEHAGSPNAGAQTRTDPTPGRSRPSGGPGGTRRLGVSAFLLGGRLVPGDIGVCDGEIATLGLPPGRGGIAVGGLVDLQVNGYAGVDALTDSPEELLAMGESLARDGVLAYQPTLISSDLDRMREAADRFAGLGAGRGLGARVLGVHLEGPFLAPRRAGTHPVDRLRAPDLEIARSLLSSGAVTMVTLAPELTGALELVRMLVGLGTVVSFGHSAANAEEARRGFDAGGRAVTHLYNAMEPMSARAPGLAGAGLTDGRVVVQLIADGVHVAPDLLRLALAAAPGRWNLVSDATTASGLGNGEVTLGEVEAVAEAGVVRRADGTIAGSAARLLDGVRHVAGLGVELGTVLAAASERPGALLGKQAGRLAVGFPADVVVLNEALELDEVLIGGRPVLRG